MIFLSQCISNTKQNNKFSPNKTSQYQIIDNNQKINYKMNINHRYRRGNIGKIKYYLPRPRSNQQSEQVISYIESGVTRKQSLIEQHQNLSHVIDIKNFTKNQLPFEVLGVSDINNINRNEGEEQKKDEKQKIFKMFPEGKQKDDFLKFVDQLKYDKNYQNTITMFTIMYYYQKKTGQSINNFL